MPDIVEAGGFMVVGIALRTSNAQEMGPHAQIGHHWTRFLSEKWLDKIPDKADGNIVAVYTDYASDQDGEYTLLIGARVRQVKGNLPPGLVVKGVPPIKYAAFRSDTGPAAKVVPETWMRVWSASKSEIGGTRAYRADFELYDERARKLENTQVDIYIGIK
jgi:predicted transcriptional regulator YdeE